MDACLGSVGRDVEGILAFQNRLSRQARLRRLLQHKKGKLEGLKDQKPPTRFSTNFKPQQKLLELNLTKKRKVRKIVLPRFSFG